MALREINGKNSLSMPSPEQSSFWHPFHRFSSYVQTKILQYKWLHPLLRVFYFVDFFPYYFNRYGFYLARRTAVGPTFTALGRVVFSSYDEVAKVLCNGQKRGTYVGRAAMIPEKCPASFLLFLSNTDEDNQHEGVREVAVHYLFNADTKKRANDATARSIVHWFAEELKKAPRDKTTKINMTETIDFPEELLNKVVLRWMHYSVLGLYLEPTDPILDDMIHMYAKSNYIKTRSVLPMVAGLLLDKKDSAEREKRISHLYLTSPVLKKFKPLESCPHLDKTEFNKLLMSLMAIAGTLGALNGLAGTLSTEVKEFRESPSFSDKREDMALFLLECTRFFAPVANITVMAEEGRAVNIHGRKESFPEGTPFAASISMACMDATAFPDPWEFCPEREGLKEKSIVFNSVGMEPAKGSACPFGPTATERVCPGRHLATKLIVDVISATRFGYIKDDKGKTLSMA